MKLGSMYMLLLIYLKCMKPLGFIWLGNCNLYLKVLIWCIILLLLWKMKIKTWWLWRPKYVSSLIIILWNFKGFINILIWSHHVKSMPKCYKTMTRFPWIWNMLMWRMLELLYIKYSHGPKKNQERRQKWEKTCVVINL
jgi:hypothetical protein